MLQFLTGVVVGVAGTLVVTVPVLKAKVVAELQRVEASVLVEVRKVLAEVKAKV